MYHQDLLDEANNPSNYGELQDADIKSTQFNASCGDVITIQIKLSEDKSKIADIAWQGEGCIISQASMSVLSEELKGMEVSAVKELEQDAILELLGLEEISMGRIKCLRLGLQAVQKVI